MSIVKTPAPFVALTAFILFAPTLAHAQDQRLRISFAPAMATLGGNAELALSGNAGYRFAEHFWFEGDLTWIDAGAGGLRNRIFPLGGRTAAAGNFTDLIRFGGGMPGGGPIGGVIGGIGRPNQPTVAIAPIDFGQLQVSTDGSTLIGTMGIRYEFPVQTARFRPYVAGGLGFNNTDQSFRVEATRLTPVIDQSASRTGIAFDAGAGASIHVGGPFWGDVDARYFRLSEDRDIMRFGGGVSVRF